MKSYVLAAALLFLGVHTEAARAIEIKCIEASKYKYLYKIFNDDRRKMAEFLQVDAARLPDGEVCRAALITGRIHASAESKKLGRPMDGDRLLDVIAHNKGWLATIYLASGGGNIGHGLSLGQITRMFWLKARAPDRDQFLYRPDFFPPDAAAPFTADPLVPPELAAGWANYLRAVSSIAEVSVSASDPAQKRPRCASACTYLHTAGIDRLGTAYVHRGRPGPNDTRTLSESIEGLQKAEQAVLAHYRNMDSGEDFMRRFQNTPTATVTAATTDRFPRYIWDALHARCGKEFAPSPSGASPRQTWPPAVERCVAAVHEKERLAQFAKYCGEGCNRTRILERVRTYTAELRGTAPAQAAPAPKKMDEREVSGHGWYCRASSTGTGYGWARRGTRAEAAKRALDICNERYGQCRPLCCVPPGSDGRSGACER